MSFKNSGCQCVAFITTFLISLTKSEDFFLITQMAVINLTVISTSGSDWSMVLLLELPLVLGWGLLQRAREVGKPANKVKLREENEIIIKNNSNCCRDVLTFAYGISQLKHFGVDGKLHIKQLTRVYYYSAACVEQLQKRKSWSCFWF